jgi:beta-glucosidase
MPVYNPTDRSTYALYVSSGGQRVALGADLNAVFNLPTVKVETAQVNTQQDAKRLTWTGPAKLEAQAAKAIALPAYASRTARCSSTPSCRCAARQGPVGMETVELDASAVFQQLAGKGKQTVKIPLACFSAQGLRWRP